MKWIGSIVIVALLVGATGFISGAHSQQLPAQPEPSGVYGMGHAMMNGGTMGHGMMSRGMMGWGSPQVMCAAMTGHLEGRLAYVKAELKVTDAQEPLWQAYAAAARDNAKTMLDHCSAMMDQRSASAASLPERLDKHEQLMTTQLEAVRAMNKALKPLYAALSDSQKRAAEDMFWGHMGMMF